MILKFVVWVLEVFNKVKMSFVFELWVFLSIGKQFRNLYLLDVVDYVGGFEVF